MFEGRILQCNQGHSVCEGCVKKINRHLNNECPHCRGAFVGTRNYILEEMVKQLKHLKASVMVKKTTANNDTASGRTGGPSNAKTVSNEHDSDGDDIDDAKLTKAIANLVLSIPKPSKQEPQLVPATDSSRQLIIIASTSASPEPGMYVFVCVCVNIGEEEIIISTTFSVTHTVSVKVMFFDFGKKKKI